MNLTSKRTATTWLIIQASSAWLFTWLFACGAESRPTGAPHPQSTTNSADLIYALDGKTPQIGLTHIQNKVTSHETILNIDYLTSDYVSVLRCRTDYKLRSPTGDVIRTSSGQILSKNTLELRAAWDSAFSAMSSCRILGERVVRHAFTDPLASNGSYFYIFNPCREKLSTGSTQPQTVCSFELRSSQDIQITSTVDNKTFQLSDDLFRKEAQLASVILSFRERLMTSLRAQQSCENQATVDAVQESKRKALMSILLTSLAASVGGAVAGSQGAFTAAQKTLQWIKEHTNLQARAQPTQCKELLDAEALVTEQAAKIDAISKEISQLRAELALALPGG